MLEILYEKYILISFSAREGEGEKENGNSRGTASATHLGGIPLFVITVVTGIVL